MTSPTPNSIFQPLRRGILHLRGPIDIAEYLKAAFRKPGKGPNEILPSIYIRQILEEYGLYCSRPSRLRIVIIHITFHAFMTVKHLAETTIVPIPWLRYTGTIVSYLTIPPRLMTAAYFFAALSQLTTLLCFRAYQAFFRSSNPEKAHDWINLFKPFGNSQGNRIFWSSLVLDFPNELNIPITYKFHRLSLMLIAIARIAGLMSTTFSFILHFGLVCKDLPTIWNFSCITLPLIALSVTWSHYFLQVFDLTIIIFHIVCRLLSLRLAYSNQLVKSAIKISNPKLILHGILIQSKIFSEISAANHELWCWFIAAQHATMIPLASIVLYGGLFSHISLVYQSIFIFFAIQGFILLTFITLSAGIIPKQVISIY